MDVARRRGHKVGEFEVGQNVPENGKSNASENKK